MFLLLICGLMVLPIIAQRTFYYKMVKKREKGVESTNVSGGQFFTFYPDMCFESTRDGHGIGHETLKLVSMSSQETVYKGKSYWDDATLFKFMNCYTEILVITASGDQYGYVCSVPPNNIKTCSLIRKNKPKESTYSSGTTYIPLPNNQSIPSKTKSKQRTPCSLCGGTGRIVKEAYVGASGTKKWCYECNRNVYTGHIHGTCTNCRGAKYIYH